MSRWHDPDDPERQLARNPNHPESELGPLFAPEPTSTDLGMAARDRAAAQHERDIARLVPIARELAAKAGASGVTVSDLRLAAVQRGILTGQETGRRLSFLGAVMQSAGLVSTGRYRRSDIARAHGNLGVVWALPEYAKDGAA